MLQIKKHKLDYDVGETEKDLSDSKLFLKIAFIQQIIVEKILVKDKVHGLLDTTYYALIMDIKN